MEHQPPRAYLFRMLHCAVGPLPHRGVFRIGESDENVGGFAGAYSAEQDALLWEKVDEILDETIYDPDLVIKLVNNSDAFRETATLMTIKCIPEDDGIVVQYRNASRGHVETHFSPDHVVPCGLPTTHFRTAHLCDFLTDVLSQNGESEDDLVPLGDTCQIIPQHGEGYGGMVRIIDTQDEEAENVIPAELVEICITDIITSDNREFEIQRVSFDDDEHSRVLGLYRIWKFDDGAIVRPMVTDVPSGKIMFIPN